MVAFIPEIRTTFKNKVFAFCVKNHILITRTKRIGKFMLYELEGDEINIDVLMEYVKKLENDRSLKSIWNRSWN